jgi:hypothetical protein
MPRIAVINTVILVRTLRKNLSRAKGQIIIAQTRPIRAEAATVGAVEETEGGEISPTLERTS